MTKFFIGVLVGIIIAVLVLSAIYGEVAAGLESGALFPNAWEVVKAWVATLKE